MALPNIDIEFQNGALEQVVPLPDGVFGVITMADEVADTFEHEKAYVVKSMQDVADLGIIDEVENHRLYKFLSEFYEEAGEGTELWVMAFDKEKSSSPRLMSDLFTPDAGKAPAEKLLDAANGKLRGLFALWNPADYGPSIEDGLDRDVWRTKTVLQTLLDNYTNTKKAPMFAVIEGVYFTGDHTELLDLNEDDDNRVGIFIGNTNEQQGIKYTALGVLAGRLARYPVHVNAGKVANGSLKPLTFYIKDVKAEEYDVESLHDKGYITVRTHVGRSGYFFTDDPLATSPSDDYKHLTHRRVIDKAYRIIYDTMLEYLLDDLHLLPNGALSPIYANTVSGRVINAIYNQMTVNGELSADLSDPNDKAVICEFDLTHNVASTSRVKFKRLQVLPKGHARFIDIPLGFVPVSGE